MTLLLKQKTVFGIILGFNFSWRTLEGIPNLKPNTIKLLDGFSWSQLLEQRNKYLEAVNYSKDINDIGENKEPKEAYLEAKQEYDNAFYCLGLALSDFHGKLSRIYIDDKSIELIKLINEFTEFYKIYPKTFKYYKDLSIIYAFASYFAKLFRKNKQKVLQRKWYPTKTKI